MNGIRTYEVEYLVNAGGNAASYFETLAKGTAGMVEPLKQMEANIGKLSSTLKSFKQDETLKNLFTIKPTIDTSTFQTQLKGMQDAVKVAAEKMSMELNKALSSAASFKPIDFKKAIADSKKEMSARLTDIEKTWNKLAPGKDIRTIKSSRSVSSEAWKVRNQYKDIATQLGVWGAKASKAAQQVINSATTADQIQSKADAVKKLNDSLSKFTTGKSYKVKISADISQAVSKINTLLTTIRESTAAIPVTLAGENKSAKGKSISKTGNVTKTGAKNVQAAVNNDIMSSLLKGQEKAATLKINADISPALEQLSALLEKISTSAAKIPVSIASAAKEKATKGKTTAAKEDFASKLLAGKKQSATLKIDADTAPALAKIAELIEKVQSSAATMPVTLSASSKTGKTKGDGTKTKTTATDSALANIVKGKEQVLDIKAKFNGSQLVAQLTESIANLQNVAKERPVIIRGTFNGSEAGFQLNQSIANLQRLANSKPVVLSTTTSSAGAKANDGTIPPAPVSSTKESGGTKQTSGTSAAKGGTASTSIIATPAQERAAIQWENGIKQSQLNNWASSLKQKYAEQARIHSERQAMYERLWGKKPPMTITPKQIEAYQKWASVMSEQRLQRSLAYGDEVRSQSNAYHAQRQAMYERLWGEKPPMTITPKPSVVRAIDTANAEQLARVKAYNAATQPQTAATSAPMLAPSSSTRGMSFPRRATIKAPKVPDPWYQFTGNTSFGARTPMAVDMAKGMGTMFAIGGAMSAVGNSLRQAMSYQNTMRTTQAILKHGKTPYVESDFTDMEQTARRIGKETKFTAPQVAQATKFLAMAGYNAKESKDAIKPIADIALIGDTDLGETADKLTNVMTAFGKNPKQMQDVADIMTTTFTRSNTDMMMLAESAKYAGGIANLYGGSFKNNFADVMAMFGIMGNAGIQASSAGTTLRMMYQNLMKPNKNQLATLKQYGIFTRDTNGQPLEMTNILMQIQKKVPQNKMADAIGSMFRITAQPGAAALATHIDDLIDLMQANRAAAGSGITEQIVDEKKNTIQGLWAQVSSTFTEGILQAFEGQEGGWAKQLADLRDYLARPETVDMLKSVVSLVETLAKTLGWFAKIWANLYNLMPGFINGWMKMQLMFTQIGFLITPFRQLYKTMQSLGAMMNGVAASTTTLTFAEQGIGRARQANAATNLVGGAAPIAGTVGAKATNAANYAAYASSMAYWRNKRTTMKNIANFHGGRAMSALKGMPDSTWWAIAAINPSLASAIKSNPAVGLQMYADRYKNSVVATEYAKASRAAKYASFADSKMVAARTQYHEALRAARRPEQLANRALMARYAAMGGDAALIAQSNAIIAKRDARIASIATARHAARGPVAISTAARVARRGGWGAQAFAITNGFAAGMQAGSFGKLGIWGSLKSGFATLMGGLAKAIGMLVSPIGLVTTAIAGLGVMLYKAYKDAKERKKQLELADKNSHWVEDSYKQLQSDYLQASIDSGGFKPVVIGYAKQAENEDKPTYSLEGNNIAQDLLDGKTDQLNGWSIYDKYVQNYKLLPGDLISQWKRDSDITSMFLPNYVQAHGGKPEDYKLYEQEWLNYQRNHPTKSMDEQKTEAQRLAMISQWSGMAIQQSDVQKAMKDMQKAFWDKDGSKIVGILNAFKPTSTRRMTDLENVNQIHDIKDPTQFYEWQYAQWKALSDMAQNYMGPAQNYQKAMNMISDFKNTGKTAQGRELVQTLMQAVPISYNGKQAQITLDKMGNVDWIALAKSVNDGIPLSIAAQQDILRSTYDAICNDPNIKNLSSVISLLNTYLPQIANARNPWSETELETWSDANKNNNNKKNGQNSGSTTPPLLQNAESNSEGIDLAHPKWGQPGTIYNVTTPNVPSMFKIKQLQRDYGVMEGTSMYMTMYPQNFNNYHEPQNKNSITNNGQNGGNGKNHNKDYKNTYNRSAARPTQVIINIDKLANFDRTAITKNADDQAIINNIETKIAEAVAMLSAQALNSAGSLISQGV